MITFDPQAFEEARRAYARSHGLPERRSKSARGGGRSGLVAALLLGSLVAVALASGAGAQSGSSITSALHLGERNPASGGTAAETKVIGDSSGWVTRQSNLGTGGAAIYGCRAPGSGTCLRATNLKTGQAFMFTTRGPLGGTIRVGAGGDAARPFTTNATGVASGLNADRLDGHHAGDFVLKGGSIGDAARLGGRSADDFLAANGTAVNSAKLGGRAADQFLAADGKAANSALLDGHAAGEFLAADGTAADSAMLDGMDSTQFLQTSRIAALRRPATFSVGDTVDLGSAQGISVRASCTGTSVNPAVHILVSTDTVNTRVATLDQPLAQQTDVSPADGYKEVLVADNNFLGTNTVAPVSVAIVKPNGTALQGEITVAVAWAGQDCHASGMLFG